MPYPVPKEVEHVKQLLLEERTEEASNILDKFEKEDDFLFKFYIYMNFLFLFREYQESIQNNQSNPY